MLSPQPRVRANRSENRSTHRCRLCREDQTWGGRGAGGGAGARRTQRTSRTEPREPSLSEGLAIVGSATRNPCTGSGAGGSCLVTHAGRQPLWKARVGSTQPSGSFQALKGRGRLLWSLLCLGSPAGPLTHPQSRQAGPVVLSKGLCVQGHCCPHLVSSQEGALPPCGLGHDDEWRTADPWPQGQRAPACTHTRQHWRDLARDRQAHTRSVPWPL